MPAMKPRISLLPVLILGMGAIAIALHAASDQSPNYTTRTLALPDHGHGNITMDYIAYDPKTGYVWVPAINVGSVYVVDTAANASALADTLCREKNRAMLFRTLATLRS